MYLWIIPSVILEKIFNASDPAPRADIIWTTVGSISYMVLGSMILNQLRSETEAFTTSELGDSRSLANTLFATGSFRFQDLCH